LPSYVRVTNLTNGKSLIVRVNDRGPYHGNRIIDVSTRASHLLGFYNRGTVPVRVEYVGRAPIEGSDDRILEATLRDNEPAPVPWNLRLAATSIAPNFPAQPPPVHNPRFASSSANDLSTGSSSARAMSFAETPSRDGTEQVLTGRGLY
jgi:rare lipoprotein A